MKLSNLWSTRSAPGIAVLVAAFTLQAFHARASDLVHPRVSFVVDESRSMVGEQSWVGDLVLRFDDQLAAQVWPNSVGEIIYSVVGFRADARFMNVRGQAALTALDVATVVGELETKGGAEDGYKAIKAALEFTDPGGGPVHIVLVTDEPRTPVHRELTRERLLKELEDVGAVVHAVLINPIRCGDDTGAIGLDASGHGYQAHAVHGIRMCTEGEVLRFPHLHGFADYTELALASGGSVWNLQRLRRLFSEASPGHTDALRTGVAAFFADQVSATLPGPMRAVVHTSPERLTAGGVVTFDGTRSHHTEPGYSIYSYEWDLDNDGVMDEFGPLVARIYGAPGEYSVTLRLTDDAAPPLITQKRIKFSVQP